MKKILFSAMLLFGGTMASVLQAQSPIPTICSSSSPSSGGIVPTIEIFPGGEPDCGTARFHRFNSPEPGQTVYSDIAGNKITINISSSPDNCGEILTWTVTGNIIVDRVVAKGGSEQNVYDYTNTNPRAGTDGNIHCPVNLSGKYADFSHVDFCFRYQLNVSKTAQTSFTRTYIWEIEKSVSPASWNFFCGDKGTSTYTVKVNGNGFTDNDWKVDGNITISNNTPELAVITNVADLLGNNVTGTVDCSVTFPYELKPGESLTCTYSAGLSSATNGTNTAMVTTSSPLVLGSSGTADYTFGSPTTEVNKTVNITDNTYTPASPWTATYGNNETFSYTREFNCTDPATGSNVCDNGGTYTFNNTAKIKETGQTDDAAVSVACHKLVVSKDAATSLTRTWAWTIDKTADQSALTLSAGQTFLVNYQVEVNASYSDANWAVSGNISVENPAPIPVMINSVSDVVSPAISAAVNCGVTFPYILAAGATLTCTYSADLPDASTRTNTATATIQNYSIAADGTKSASGTTDYSGNANVDFSTASITKVDECADISDNLAGALGTVCAADVPKTFNYSYNVGPYTTPGIYTVNNTATLTTGSGTKKDDSWGVTVTIPGQGCTLTQGYWKTHSKSGPAPYDDAWKNLGELEENTAFFLSGKTWYEVFWTPPAGNAYYNLAHQYMAAKLNILNGASAPTAVTNAMASAETLFATYTPSQITNQLARTFRNLATTLDQYNNGLIGPGHCDENISDTRLNISTSAPLTGVIEEGRTAPQITNGLKVWPNPSAVNFSLRYESQNLSMPVHLRVFDMSGKLVYTASGNANQTFRFGEKFAKGIYLVEIIQEKDRLTQRLIKQ